MAKMYICLTGHCATLTYAREAEDRGGGGQRHEFPGHKFDMSPNIVKIQLDSAGPGLFQKIPEINGMLKGRSRNQQAHMHAKQYHGKGRG